MFELEELAKMNFDGKGEAYVEQRFLMPLLKALGYESHKDYEVKVHGDEGTSFKLKYPPVERGAQKVKHYNPDYMPNIRKKCFWIIETKSPKDVKYPFEEKYIIQGLQYCIHPEIRAKYLVISNGENTAIYDAFSNIYYNEDSKVIYEPIFEFKNKEIIEKWICIYNLLSVEKIREMIELDLIKMFEKVSESSLDEEYPQKFWGRIGENVENIKNGIKKHVIKLSVEEVEENIKERIRLIENASINDLYNIMAYEPLTSKAAGEIFVERLIQNNKTETEIIKELISTYDKATIFKKQNIFCAMCKLYNISKNNETKQQISNFLNENKDKDIELVNKVECKFLSIFKKILIVDYYQDIREKIKRNLKYFPEIERFINPPTALSLTYSTEICTHKKIFNLIKEYDDQQLNSILDALEEIDKNIQPSFELKFSELNDDEIEIDYGFIDYDKHYKAIFNNIIKNYNINL